MFIGNLTRRRLSLGALGFLGAAAMFGSGVVVARATMDSDSAPASPSGGEVLTIGRADGAGSPGYNPSAARNGAAVPMSGEAADSVARTGYWGGCEAPIGDIFNGTAIDPAKLGFDLQTPGDGFTLTSVNLRRQGECDDTGNAADGDVVVDTRWRHNETGLTAWLSQRVEPDRTSNVLLQGSAEFWSEGYAFSAGVNVYQILPLDTGAAEDAARDSGGDVATTDIASAPARMSEPDPRAQALLESIVTTVAPDVGLECFYRQAQSSWEDLAAAGIGDPRGAIPGGYTENYLNSMRLDPPAPGCNTPAPEYGQEFFFDTAFSDNAGGFLSISVYPVPADFVSQPGRLEQGSLSWNSDRYQFYVSGPYGPEGQSDVDLTAVARALDSGFAQRCIVQATALSESDLAAHGIARPLVPDGFRVDSTWFQSYAASGDCSSTPGADGGFRATWAMFNQGPSAMIELTISKGVDSYAGGESNTATPYGYFWTDANGVNYALNGYKGQVGEETLVAVAKSVDPTFDASTLTQRDEIDAVPMPKPVR